MAPTVDLRGTNRSSRPKGALLADPSGRRARVLRQLGRVVGALFVLWLIGLLLGLGILPGIDLHRHHKNTASKHRVTDGSTTRPATVASGALVALPSAGAGGAAKSAVGGRSTSAAGAQKTGGASAATRANRPQRNSGIGQAQSISRGRSATAKLNQTASHGKALARGKVHQKHPPHLAAPNAIAKDGNGPRS